MQQQDKYIALVRIQGCILVLTGGHSFAPRLIHIRQGNPLNSMIKDTQRQWKCNNPAFLNAFLARNYPGVDNPTDSIQVDDHTTKLIFETNNGKKVIYQYVNALSTEYFTKSSWYLFSITKDYHKAEFDRFVVFYDQTLENLRFVKFIENYIDTISDILLLESNVKVEIYILPKDVFNTLFTSDEVTGFFDPVKGKVYVDKLDYHATHEIVHSLMNQWGIYPNVFCSEGMAECFKKPIEIPAMYIKNVKSFSDVFFDRNGITRERYGVAGLFFRYIFEQYGVSTIQEICKKSFDANCEKTEEIIMEETHNNSFLQSFVEWFEKLDLDSQNWYLQNELRGND